MTTVQKEQILIITSDSQVNYLLDRLLQSIGFNVKISTLVVAALRELTVEMPSLVILSEKLTDGDGLELAGTILRQYPTIPVVLFVKEDRPEILKSALKLGLSDYVCLPLKSEDLQKTIQNSLMKVRLRKEWMLLESRRATTSLQRRLDELQELTRLGRSITSSLDLDQVLMAVVDAAVAMTNAEEGSLLLLDHATGELYMRAARNFQEDFVRKFRLPIQDTLAGSVLRTGQPVVLDEKSPQKIKTSYLVHSLAYVPLQSHGRVFGVLGVDNRLGHAPLAERDIALLTTLAEYAVIAIENAGLYTDISQEKNKLNTILTNIHDGVIVVDRDHRLVFANKVAQESLGGLQGDLSGKPVGEVFSQTELIELVTSADGEMLSRQELTVADGRIFNVRMAAIPGVGQAVTLHDITYLKRLDQIKSEFVSTVSHDLRSPLTAILGYVELIERVGPVNDTQREFIKRVTSSAHNITRLVDDLLNLGKIEAGFDTGHEVVRLDHIIRLSSESFQSQLENKQQRLELKLPDSLPELSANPVQIRQMVDNLVDNAIKYSPVGSRITVSVGTRQNQVIFQVVDAGIGIPAIDLPYIFDKFYRGGNCGDDTHGTGLGLAIVKSIVDAHNGRIWVDSTVGQGTTFTVVLPIASGSS